MNKTKNIILRVSLFDEKLIKIKAKECGLSVSEYLRRCALDFYSSIALMYVILLPCDDYFSLRYLNKKNNRKENLTPFRRLFQIHLCIAYFFSGFQKLLGYNWWNGEAIWKAVHLPNFYNEFNINYDYIVEYPIIFIIIGWSIIIIELFYFIFINIKITRKLWLFLTISMHLGIVLTLNLFFFSTLMIILNITNYYYENKITNIN